MNTMPRWLLIVFLLSLAPRVSAQTPVLPLSFQCHWMDTTIDPTTKRSDGHMEHLHVEPTVPLGDVTTPSLDVPFVIGLFDTTGQVYEVDVIATTAHGSVNATSVTVPPGMIGTRGQYVTFGAHASVPVPLARGYYMVEIAVKIALPDGINMVTWVRRPVHARLDASVPEPDLISGATAAQTRCIFGTPHNQVQSYGQLTAQFDLLPPTDIAAITPITISGYGYGRFGVVPPATLRFVLNPNFHAGDPGTTLVSQSSLQDIIHLPAAFDHPGLNKYAVIQEQMTLDGTEHAMSLLVAQVAGTSDLKPAEPPPVIVPPPVVTPPPPAPTFVKVKGMCAEELFSDGSVKTRCLDLP